MAEPPAEFFVPAVADRGRLVAFPFDLLAPACWPFTSAFGGVSELSVPSRPRFMILAGVTGMMGAWLVIGADVCSPELIACMELIGA